MMLTREWRFSRRSLSSRYFSAQLKPSMEAREGHPGGHHPDTHKKMNRRDRVNRRRTRKNRSVLAATLLSMLALRIQAVTAVGEQDQYIYSSGVRRSDEIPEPEQDPASDQTPSPSTSFGPSVGTAIYEGEPLYGDDGPTTSPGPSSTDFSIDSASPTLSMSPTDPVPIDFVDGVDTVSPTAQPTVTSRPTTTPNPTGAPSMSSGPTLTGAPSAVEITIPVDFEGFDCFSTWRELANAVGTATGERIFKICSNSTFALTPIDDPIELNSSNTTLECGPDGKLENRCAIFGGTEHFRIVGSGTSVVMRGLTMIASNVAAVQLEADETSHVLFQDCEFSGHLGQAAVFNYRAEFINSTSSASRGGLRHLQASSLSPPAGRSMTVDFDSCVFNDNIVTYAPISNFRGNTTVTGSVFSGNTGGEAGSIGNWFGGQVAVSKSCFIGNVADQSSSIFVDEESVVSEQTDNFAEPNGEAKPSCPGVLVEGGDCDSFTADMCLAPRVVDSLNSTDGDSTIECVSEWTKIHALVMNGTVTGESVTVHVCAGSSFNMSAYEELGLAPLIIESNEITIKCGDDGLRRNDCILFGGTRHIEISGNSTSVTVHGLTMQNSTDVSVAAETPTGSMSLVFKDCLWKHNSGEATFSIKGRESAAVIVPTASPSASASPSTGNEDGGLTDDLFLDDFLARDLQADEPFATVYIGESSFDSNAAVKGILVNTGADLRVEACQFDENVVGRSIIAAREGTLNMTSCCFHGNEYIAEEGLVSSTSFMGFTATNNFGESNLGVSLTAQPGCEGVRSSDGSCTEFDAPTCPLLPNSNCHATWEDLASTIGNASSDQTGGVFTICRNSTLVVNTAPISIEVSDIVIQCGTYGFQSDLCTIAGGDIQFQVAGVPTGVQFRGLTFSNSTSAAVFAAGERSARASFIDCRFMDHRGFAAILIYQGAFPSPGTTIADVPPPGDRSMQIQIAYCTFSSNIVLYAPVTNLDGSVSIANSIFEDNQGESGGIGVWHGGGTTLVQSCFVGNTGKLSASVYVGLNSTLSKESDNYGTNSTVLAGDCSDVFLAEGCESDGVCNGLCIAFSQQACAAEEPPTFAPSSSPSSSPTSLAPDGCFADWSALSLAIRLSDFSLGSEKVFNICSNSVLDVTLYPEESISPIVLSEGDVLIQCGDDGKFENNCTIRGGSSHFRITNAPERITLSGLQMEGSTVASVLAMGASNSRVAFEQCQWKRNSGVAAVLVYNEQTGEPYTGQTDIGKLDVPSSESMTATFDFCEFVENTVSFASIASVAGTLVVYGTSFIENTGAQAGVISASGNALFSIGSSCFVDNQSDFPGTIFLSQGSQITSNSDNYGFDNRAGTVGECKDVFQETTGSCFEDLTCDGVCAVFEERSCSIPDFDYEVPTFTPTESPSFEPGSAPAGDVPSALSTIVYETQAFAGTSQFITTLVLVLVIIFGGICAYLLGRRRGKNKTAAVYAVSGSRPPEASEPFIDDSNAPSQQEYYQEDNGSSFHDEHPDDDDDPFEDE